MRLEPARPDQLLETVHHYSVILNQPPSERLCNLPGLVRLARYLLRTAVYAQAMRIGPPCFSVRELASKFGDPDLATLLASDPIVTGPPTIDILEDLVKRLTTIVGPLPPNTYGSISALAVATWDEDRILATLAIRAASDDENTLDYSDLPKVLL